MPNVFAVNLTSDTTIKEGRDVIYGIVVTGGVGAGLTLYDAVDVSSVEGADILLDVLLSDEMPTFCQQFIYPLECKLGSSFTIVGSPTNVVVWRTNKLAPEE